MFLTQSYYIVSLLLWPKIMPFWSLTALSHFHCMENNRKNILLLCFTSFISILNHMRVSKSWHNIDFVCVCFVHSAKIHITVWFMFFWVSAGLNTGFMTAKPMRYIYINWKICCVVVVIQKKLTNHPILWCNNIHLFHWYTVVCSRSSLWSHFCLT